MAGQPFEVISQHRCFGGTVGFYRHEAASTACAMRFAVFTPSEAKSARVPVLYYLAGLTCTEETFMIKAGAQRVAAELGLMLVAPDTSPRGVKLPGDSDSWDFGVARGFYLDATAEPWSRHYRMYTYVTQELRTLIEGTSRPTASVRGSLATRWAATERSPLRCATRDGIARCQPSRPSARRAAVPGARRHSAAIWARIRASGRLMTPPSWLPR